MKESMGNIINLVEIQSPIPNFDGDDKGISCGLLPRFNIVRERWRIVAGMRETKRLAVGSSFEWRVSYFAGTARNQPSNPNRINVPTSEKSVCNG
jgi:hypothetical protein